MVSICSQLKKQIKERLSALPLSGLWAGHHLIKTKSDLFPLYWNIQLKITAIICFIYFSFWVPRIIYIYLLWLDEILLKKCIFFVLYYFIIISHVCSSSIRSCPSILIGRGYESVDTGLWKAQNILFPTCTSHFPQLRNMKTCYYWG